MSNENNDKKKTTFLYSMKESYDVTQIFIRKMDLYVSSYDALDNREKNLASTEMKEQIECFRRIAASGNQLFQDFPLVDVTLENDPQKMEEDAKRFTDTFNSNQFEVFCQHIEASTLCIESAQDFLKSRAGRRFNTAITEKIRNTEGVNPEDIIEPSGSFNIRPMQILPRHELIMKSIIDNMPENTQQKDNLHELQNRITSSATNMNNALSRMKMIDFLSHPKKHMRTLNHIEDSDLAKLKKHLSTQPDTQEKWDTLCLIRLMEMRHGRNGGTLTFEAINGRTEEQQSTLRSMSHEDLQNLRRDIAVMKSFSFNSLLHDNHIQVLRSSERHAIEKLQSEITGALTYKVGSRTEAGILVSGELTQNVNRFFISDDSARAARSRPSVRTQSTVEATTAQPEEKPKIQAEEAPKPDEDNTYRSSRP